MKIKSILVLLLLSVLLSCGVTNIIKPQPPEDTGYIRNLSMANNRLRFETEDSTHVHIKFNNFEGWSAGDQRRITHNYPLPMTPGDFYEINLKVTNGSISVDTTFTYTAQGTVHSFLTVHFIDVQQGDAIFIQTPDHQTKHIMIDGGYGTVRNQAWQGGGVPIALNYLLERNIEHVDIMIESHRHEDHWGGLRDIQRSHIFNEDRGSQYISNEYHFGYSSGSFLNIDSTTKFQFYNVGLPPTYIGTEPNNTSIVIRMTYGDAAFLFTGDALGDVQNWMYSQGYDLSVDVLKVSHHGSHTHNTSDALFLSRTLNRYCKIAILLYGANNPHNHPASISRFRNFDTYGTNTLPTGVTIPGGGRYRFNTGTIVVYTDGRMIYVTTER
jgi:beta-lactamase superfamily II metal-dependent hydrolase